MIATFLLLKPKMLKFDSIFGVNLIAYWVSIQYHLVISCHSERRKPSPQNFVTSQFLPFCHNMREFWQSQSARRVTFLRPSFKRQLDRSKKLDTKIFLSVKMVLICRGYNFGTEKKNIFYRKSDFGIINQEFKGQISECNELLPCDKTNSKNCQFS